MTGPTINRGGSRQDYSTDPLFMKAVVNRFGPLTMDLAADEFNSKCESIYFDEEEDSLNQEWHRVHGVLWLNPPFGNIAPWAIKCHEESLLGAKILFLTPASIGSNWFRDRVHHKALVLALNGRLTFEGETQPYPKDCMLSVYGFGAGFDVWSWRENS